MIPKRAWFYWSGPPMSWLRRQSVETFQRLNPDWECRFIYVQPGGGEVILRQRVINSDYSRYDTLAKLGGMYFDTDIVFTAPIPEAWLEKDNCMVSRNGNAQGVAVLGGKEGSKFFASLVDACNHRLKSKAILAYQSFGIKLFGEMDPRQLASSCGETLFEIPIEFLFPRPWGGVEYLWSDVDTPTVHGLVGVHWFGGDELSREYEPKITPDTLDDYPCIITKALKQQVMV